MAIQFSQTPHGSFSSFESIFIQFNDLAMILAVVVFPTPRTPVSKYALAIRSV